MLTIPSLLIIGMILTGSPYDNNKIQHNIEANKILESNIYKYHGYNAYGAHDYGIFNNLPSIRKNAVVIIDGKRYHVKSMRTIHKDDVTAVLNDSTILFTCTNGNEDRFIVELH